MLEERHADDIRIGHLDGFLDAQFGKAMAHFLPMYLGFARFPPSQTAKMRCSHSFLISPHTF